MNNSHNIKTSICLFISVFLITLIFNYFYQTMKNKDDTEYKFDWNKYILISSAWGSGIALIFSLYFSFQNKKESTLVEDYNLFSEKNVSMKQGMGCGCTGKQSMQNPMNILKPKMYKKYSMNCQ